jgi:hypothetical protein
VTGHGFTVQGAGFGVTDLSFSFRFRVQGLRVKSMDDEVWVHSFRIEVLGYTPGSMKKRPLTSPACFRVKVSAFRVLSFLMF